MRYRQWRTREYEEPKPAPNPGPTPNGPWWTRPDNPQPDDPWWLHYGRHDRRGRYGRRGHPGIHNAHPKLLVAIFLICAGAILFLDNIGLLAVRDIWSYWPLILVAVGISRLASPLSSGARFKGIILILLGVAFLADKFRFVFITADFAWPILLIAFGAAILFKALDAHRVQPSGFAAAPNIPPNAHPGFTDHNTLKEWVVFGNLKRSISTPDFRGGEVFSVFGEINIDLRHAQMSAAKQAVIEANATFGAVNLFVPETWRVSVRGTGIFGGYEDKTIPPRPWPGMEPPLLIITGAAVFGAVVIKS